METHQLTAQTVKIISVDKLQPCFTVLFFCVILIKEMNIFERSSFIRRSFSEGGQVRGEEIKRKNANPYDF